MGTVFPEARESIESPRIKIIDSGKPLCWCRESNPNPLGEQLLLLIAEPSLQWIRSSRPSSVT